MSRALALYRKTVGMGGMTLMGLTMSFIRYISFGRAVNFNRKLVAPIFCRGLLFLAGVKVKNKMQIPSENVIYFFNHNSFLDIFIIPLLGLKNTRFIITEGVKSILPLHLCNMGIDVLYIPTKSDPDRRLAFFKRVTQDLKDNKYSVICSPEGQHPFAHYIAPFNKGVFHMAAKSGRPIQTLFFDIPRDANPLQTLDMQSCEVTIHSKEFIATDQWSEQKLDEYRVSIRTKFLEYYHQTYGDYGDSNTQEHFS